MIKFHGFLIFTALSGQRRTGRNDDIEEGVLIPTRDSARWNFPATRFFNMENFIIAVKTISADKNYHQLSELLNKNAEQLLQNATNIDLVVGALDPEQHCTAFLALL